MVQIPAGLVPVVPLRATAHITDQLGLPHQRADHGRGRRPRIAVHRTAVPPSGSAPRFSRNDRRGLVWLDDDGDGLQGQQRPSSTWSRSFCDARSLQVAATDRGRPVWLHGADRRLHGAGRHRRPVRAARGRRRPTCDAVGVDSDGMATVSVVLERGGEVDVGFVPVAGTVTVDRGAGVDRDRRGARAQAVSVASTEPDGTTPKPLASPLQHTGEGTADVTALLFSPADGTRDQTVTVIGVDDDARRRRRRLHDRGHRPPAWRPSPPTRPTLPSPTSTTTSSRRTCVSGGRCPARCGRSGARRPSRLLTKVGVRNL